MREILFRAKRADNKEWVYGSLHIEWGETRKDGSRNKDYRILGMRGECYYVDPNTIGQYAGIPDNALQRIFEGDIMRILPDDGEMGVIKWADDEAMFVLETEGWCANFDNYYSKDLEVIGNIHDNPELLEGGE